MFMKLNNEDLELCGKMMVGYLTIRRSRKPPITEIHPNKDALCILVRHNQYQKVLDAFYKQSIIKTFKKDSKNFSFLLANSSKHSSSNIIVF